MKNFKILSIALLMFYLTGCSIKFEFPPVSELKQQPDYSVLNHNLTKEKYDEIKDNYLKYRPGLVAGLVSLTVEKIKESNHDADKNNILLSKLPLFECKASLLRGNIDNYFYKMFLIPDYSSQGDQSMKSFYVEMNYKNVNEINYYNEAIGVNTGEVYSFSRIDNENYKFSRNSIPPFSTKFTGNIYYDCKLISNRLFDNIELVK